MFLFNHNETYCMELKKYLLGGTQKIVTCNSVAKSNAIRKIGDIEIRPTSSSCTRILYLNPIPWLFIEQKRVPMHARGGRRPTVGGDHSASGDIPARDVCNQCVQYLRTGGI